MISEKYIEAIFDQEFFNGFYNARIVVFETIHWKGEKILSRITIKNSYEDHEYDAVTSIGDLRIEKIVKRSFAFVERKPDGLHYLDKFFSQLLKYEHLGFEYKLIDMANHNDWPGFYVDRRNVYGSRVIFHYDKSKGKLESYEKFDLASRIDEDIRKVIQAELGLEIDCFYPCFGGFIISMPYQQGAIAEWRVSKTQEGREYLKAIVHMDRFFTLNIGLKLKCILFNKNEEEILTEEKTITNEYELIHDFKPDITEPYEIYRVDLKLYSQGKLIDDYSGVPIRSITINTHILK